VPYSASIPTDWEPCPGKTNASDADMKQLSCCGFRQKNAPCRRFEFSVGWHAIDCSHINATISRLIGRKQTLQSTMQLLRQIVSNIFRRAPDGRTKILSTSAAVAFHDDALQPQKACTIVLRGTHIGAQLTQQR